MIINNMTFSESITGKVIVDYLEKIVARHRFTRTCIALSLRGERHEWAFGNSDSRDEVDQFYIGCLTKPLVAAATLELERQGVLDIEAPISNYLPEFRNTEIGESVRLCHLLSNTSGYLGYPYLDKLTLATTWEQLVSSLKEQRLLFSPGTVPSLDFSGYVLLGRIIRQVSGINWCTIVDDIIGTPLFGRSIFEGDNLWNWSAAAARIRLSANELTSIGEVLMNGKLAGTTTYALSANTVSRLRNAVVSVPPLTGENCSHWLPTSHGLGISAYHSGLHGECGKGGGDFTSLRFLGPSDLAVAVCVKSGGAIARHNILDAVLTELGIPVPRQLTGVKLNIPVEEIAGVYFGLRGETVLVTVDYPHIVVDRVGSSTSSTFRGTIHENGTISLNARQPVAGFTFFPNPYDGAPCLMLGVHALRKALC